MPGGAAHAGRGAGAGGHRRHAGRSVAMLPILLRRNQELRRDLAALHLAITGAAVPPELLPYQAHIARVCERLRREAERNLAYLQLGQGVILDDVLSVTRGLSWFSQLLCARML